MAGYRPAVAGIDLLVAALPALTEMTDRQREIFVDHVLLGRTHRAVAREQGCTPQRVAQLYRGATTRIDRHVRAA